MGDKGAIFLPSGILNDFMYLGKKATVMIAFFRIVCFLLLQLNAGSPIPSGVYRFEEQKMLQTDFGRQQTMLSGSTRDLDHLVVRVLELRGQVNIHLPKDTASEQLLIIRTGEYRVTVHQLSASVGPGSVVFVPVGVACELVNELASAGQVYTITYGKSRETDWDFTPDSAFIMDWDRIPFVAHDKGGIRRFFDRSTALCSHYEMHMTTLNAGLQSHPPHTHRAAEFILMMDGATEMSIGGQDHRGLPGDLYFLESEIPHGILNTGTTSCSYFAFQFQ